MLALAGLKRLGLDARVTEIISYDDMLPAPGQGALGIECRKADLEIRKLLNALNDRATAASVVAERAVLEALGGGCHLPLGALGTVSAETRILKLQAVLGHPDGSMMIRFDCSGATDFPEALGHIAAAELLKIGGKELIERLRSEGAKGV